MALNARQQLFVKYYAQTKNASEAARLAGYPKKHSDVQGSRLLVNASIAKAVAVELKRQLDKIDLTAEMVLAEIRKLAFADVSEAYDDDGKLLHPKNMPDGVRAALQSVEADEIYARSGKKKIKIGITKKIRLADKTRNLEMLAKHFKLLTDVQEIGNKNGEPLVLLSMPGNGSEVVASENVVDSSPASGDVKSS